MTLAITYAEVRRELGRFLAIGEDPTQWSADDVTRVADIILRGSRRFYFPEPGMLEDKSLIGHDWTFIQDSLSVTLATLTTYHDLPSDFIRLVSRPSIAGNSQPLELTTEANIRNLANSSVGEGDPVYYVIERIKPSSTDLSYQIGLYPQPIGTPTLEGDYIFDPPVASASQAPVVPSDHAETYLASLLAAAEEIMNYESSSGQHMERFKRMLAASIIRDQTIGQE
jgi:hypothetical protein